MVEALAAREGNKGLKFSYKTGHISYDDSALFAGVDDQETEDTNSSNKSTVSDQYSTDEEDEYSTDEEEEEAESEDQEDLNLALAYDEVLQPNQSPVQDDTEQDDENTHYTEEIDFEADNEQQPLFDMHEEEYERNENQQHIDIPPVRRSACQSKPPDNWKPSFENKEYQHLITQTCNNIIEYEREHAKIGTNIIGKLNLMHTQAQITGVSLAETYNIKQGLKKFGQKGKDAAMKEMKQLHDRVCF